MRKIIKYFLVAVSVSSMIAACTDSKEYETSYCTLVDISGTYSAEKKGVVNIVKAGILPRMIPGDSLFFVKIDSNSYSDENLVTKLTLDYRPTQANNQKMILAKKLDRFGSGKAKSRMTDISGAMMLCSDYLKATQSGTQVIFIFSDMKEELPAGVVRKFADDEFAGIDIAAMNVIKLKKDSANPEVYRKRMRKWDQRFISSGANSWTTLLDATKIEEFIYGVK
ncbi:MAG: hypothetical protein E2O60_02145 [Gammaproteobacteria bacterium]|nr:MAG: hypothetical protein E2O60_02145 [Gammaproteobacteria bacterium]